jgi:hypothetical protein
MGMAKTYMIEQEAIEFFLESAKADTLDEYFWNLEGLPQTRSLRIDAEGNREEHDGMLYTVCDRDIFVPDHIFGFIQPVVETPANQMFF